jgi:hypothetical protein
VHGKYDQKPGEQIKNEKAVPHLPASAAHVTSRKTTFKIETYRRPFSHQQCAQTFAPLCKITPSYHFCHLPAAKTVLRGGGTRENFVL